VVSQEIFHLVGCGVLDLELNQNSPDGEISILADYMYTYMIGYHRQWVTTGSGIPQLPNFQPRWKIDGKDGDFPSRLIIYIHI